MDNVTVTLKIGTSTMNVTPIFGDDVKLKISTEENQIFHRQKVDGTFKFTRDDFDLIEACSNEVIFTLSVYRGDTFIASGTFIKADCDLNYDDRVCTVKMTLTDRYDKILGAYDSKYNLVDLSPERWPITLYRRPVLQFYMLGDTKITNYIGNASFEETASSDAESMSESDITGKAFTKLYHYTTIELTASNSAYSAINGKYSGLYTGTGTILWRDDNAMYMECSYGTTSGGAYYYWTLYYADGTVYVLSGPAPKISIPYSSIDDVMGVACSSEQSFSFTYYTTVEVGTAVFNNRQIFCRMIHNYASSITGQTTVTLANLSTDVAERNFNFLYGSTVDDLGIDDGVIASTEVQSDPTEYGVNDDGDYFVAPTPSTTDNAMIPIAWNMWSPMSWWFEGGPWIYSVINQYYKRYVMNDAYPLWSAIKVLLAEVDSDILYDPDSSKHVFFQDGEYGDPTAGEGESDYIPSPRTRGNQLFITPITNIKKTFYEQAARKGDISLKQIFDMLRNVFQVYWWIDDTNELRMEHITYFKHNHSYAQGFPNADIDVTAMQDRPNKLAWSFATSSVTHDRSNLPSRYEFAWGDECTEQFKGYPIDIEDAVANDGKVEKIVIDNFLSDLDYITILPDNVSNDLYALIEAPTSASGTYPREVPWIEIRANSSSPYYSLMNGFLSLLFAEKYYWPYDLGGWNAKMKGDYMDVKGTRQYIVQDINFPMPIDDIATIGAVKTELGVGLVKEQEINADTLYAKSKISLEGKRDYSRYISKVSYGSGSGIVYVITNNYTDTLVVHYILQTVGSAPVLHALTLSAGASNTISYSATTQSISFIGVTNLSTFMEFGEFTKLLLSTSGMTFNVTSHSAAYAEVEIVGNGDSSGDWAYIALHCKSRTRITITESSLSESGSYGYVASEPIVDADNVTSDALAYVDGTDQTTIQYIASADEVVYLGFTKAYFSGSDGETIAFEIEVPE